MKAIAYTRKSTDKKESQVHSLEAQKREIINYAKTNNIEIIQWFSESISGTIKERPEFIKAMAQAKKHRCPIIAKSLSRIGRNASQVLQVIDDVELIITDMGKQLDENFLSLMAVINQIEVKQISKRTKSALALLKANGVLLGNRTNLEEAQELGRASHSKGANEFALKMEPFVMNNLSHSEMARQLNRAGFKTRQGKTWKPMSVSRLRKRIVFLNS